MKQLVFRAVGRAGEIVEPMYASAVDACNILTIWSFGWVGDASGARIVICDGVMVLFLDLRSWG